LRGDGLERAGIRRRACNRGFAIAIHGENEGRGAVEHGVLAERDELARRARNDRRRLRRGGGCTARRAPLRGAAQMSSAPLPTPLVMSVSTPSTAPRAASTAGRAPGSQIERKSGV